MSNQVQLLKEELETVKNFNNKRIEYLLKLGEIKLSEINNKKNTEETYFNIVELNTREVQFKQYLIEKYGDGSLDLEKGFYIKK